MASNDTRNKLQADGPGCIYHKQNSLLMCIFVHPSVVYATEIVGVVIITFFFMVNTKVFLWDGEVG